jgi:branched-chain amino acid transport system permease protein
MFSLLSSSSPRWSSFRTASLAAARQSASRKDLVALGLLVAAAPLVLPNNYTYEIAILVGVNAIVCVGLNILIGFAGQVSLGHAGFFGLGAYGSAILAARYGVPPWLSLPISVAAVSALAWLVGKPVLRLKGHYLAMATLGLGIIVAVVLATEERLTGGPDGMSVPPLTVGRWALSGEKTWYWLVGGLLIVTVWLAQNLIDSPRGRAWRALHGSEVAAGSVGIDAARHKLAAFVLSAALAGLAGALSAHYAGFITPSKASFLHSIELVTMVVFGGMASTFGAVVGAAVLTVLPQLLTVFKEYEMVLLGALMMLTMIFMPRGLVPTLERIADAARRKPG